MRHVALAALVISSTAFADSSFIQQMDKIAAKCSWNGSAGMQDAKKEFLKNGGKSEKSDSLIRKAYSDSERCVNSGLVEGRSLYIGEAKSHPSLKNQIQSFYVGWVQYMESLRSPNDFGEKRPESDNYEKAKIVLESEIDLL